MNEQTVTWHNVGSISRVVTLVSAAMENAARGLSDMLGSEIMTGTAEARVVRLGDMSETVGHPESEMVGLYLLMKGELSGQALLILPLVSALNLADLLMTRPPGTSASLGEEERSALAEVGNLTVAYFLNALASLTGSDLRPSTPAVMVNMLGAILGVLAASVGAMTDDLLIVETVLQDARGLVEARFWVLPDLVSQL